MNAELFRRVAWKEYRMLRGLWIMLAVLAIAAQMLWVVSIYNMPQTSSYGGVWLYGIALVIVVLFALGSSVILFAVEREDEMRDWLQATPASSWRLFIPKIATGLAALALLTVVLAVSTTGLAAVLRRYRPIDPDAVSSLIFQFGLTPFEVFAWGILFSMISRRTLVAAILGMAAASLTIHLSANLVATDTLTFADLRPYSQSVFPYRLGFLALAIAADVWLGRRWLAALPVEDWFSTWRRRRAPAELVAGAFDDQATQIVLRRKPSQLVTLRRLIWQAFRVGRVSMFAMLGVGTLAFVTLATMYDDARDRFGWMLAVLFGVATLMGSLVFLADHQGQQFRFLGERPVNPRLAWLSRQLAWIATIVIWSTIAVPIWIAVAFHGNLEILTKHMARWDGAYRSAQSYSGRVDQLPGWLVIALFVLLMYSVGQLCSVFIRSGVLAGVSAVILAVLVFLWSGALDLIGVSWLLAAAPIPLIALFISWFRMSDWFAERSGGRTRIRAGLSILLPAAAMIALLAICRVASVPDMSPGFSLPQYAAQVTPEARETANIYKRAGELMTGLNREEEYRLSRRWQDAGYMLGTGNLAQAVVYDQQIALWRKFIEQNSQAMPLILEASERPHCVFPIGFAFIDNTVANIQDGMELLIWDGAIHTQQGDLDTALARFLAALRMNVHLTEHQAQDNTVNISRQVLPQLLEWSIARGQTSERIRAAIAGLDRWEQSRPGPGDWIKANYEWLTDILSTDPEQRARGRLYANYDEDIKAVHLAMQVMPWERQRAIRVLNLLTASSLREIESLAAGLAADKPMTLRLMEAQMHENAEAHGWLSSTQILRLLSSQTQFDSNHQVVRLEATFALPSIKILMALVAWQIEHGELPESLNDLVGPYFADLPRDPYSGQDFRYYRHGTSKPLFERDQFGSHELPPGTPLLWGPGHRLVPDAGETLRREPTYRPIVIGRPNETRTLGDTLTQKEALPQGHAMSIPRPK